MGIENLVTADVVSSAAALTTLFLGSDRTVEAAEDYHSWMQRGIFWYLWRRRGGYERVSTVSKSRNSEVK